MNSKIYELVKTEIQEGRWVPGIPDMIYRDINQYKVKEQTREDQLGYLAEQVFAWHGRYRMCKADKIAPSTKNEHGFAKKLEALLAQNLPPPLSFFSTHNWCAL